MMEYISGVRARSGEMKVADGTGVWKTRTIQRKPLEDRWDSKSADMIQHVPWRTSEHDPKVDGERRWR